MVPSGKVIEQRLDHIEHDLRGREHRDHNPGAAHDLARSAGLYRPAISERTDLSAVTIPGDDRDALIQKSMGHR